MTLPTNFTPLPHVSTFETAHVAKDYPYGGHRTEMRFWVETRERFGQRVMLRSLNPKTGGWNKPHASGYSEIVCPYINHETGHIEHAHLSMYSSNKKELDAFQAAFAGVLTEWQSKRLNFIRTYHQANSPNSYFGFNDEQAKEYADGLAAIREQYPIKDNAEQRTKRIEARKVLVARMTGASC
jgi:hypothetical protein